MKDSSQKVKWVNPVSIFVCILLTAGNIIFYLTGLY